MTRASGGLSPAQQFGLVVLRTLIGWHFLYEGYFKLILPGWTQAGEPLARWSSAGYLKAATGPFASMFRGLAEVARFRTIQPFIELMGGEKAFLEAVLGRIDFFAKPHEP